MAEIEYTEADNTTALKALKSRIDCNGDRIPNRARETAIRILHRMPSSGTLTYDFDTEAVWKNGWTPTLYAQSAIVDAVQTRRIKERAASAPKPTSNEGPKALRDMFRF